MQLTTFSLSLMAGLGIWSLGGSSLTVTSAATPAATVAAMPQHPHGGGNHPYGLHSLQGRHGFTYSGMLQGIGPVASSGPISFDGNGHLSARYTTSVNGMPFTGSFQGTYSVNPDGTGTVLLTLPMLGLQANGDFVLVDNGQGTFFTSTDAGFSVTGSTRRM